MFEESNGDSYLARRSDLKLKTLNGFVYKHTAFVFKDIN